MKRETQIQIEDNIWGETFASGVVIETMNKLPHYMIEDDRQLNKKNLIGCLGVNLKTSASKNCRYITIVWERRIWFFQWEIIC